MVMDTRAPLHVVAALILKDEKILVAKRLPGGPHGGLWEFPGGKVEPGEDPDAALVRELEEELGIEVRVDSQFMEVFHDYDTFTIRLDTRWCTHLSGEPRTLVCAGLKWVRPSEVAGLEMPEADLPIALALARLEKR